MTLGNLIAGVCRHGVLLALIVATVPVALASFDFDADGNLIKPSATNEGASQRQKSSGKTVVGTIAEGYQFKGGDTSNPRNWKRVESKEYGEPWSHPWNLNWDSLSDTPPDKKRSNVGDTPKANPKELSWDELSTTKPPVEEPNFFADTIEPKPSKPPATVTNPYDQFLDKAASVTKSDGITPIPSHSAKFNEPGSIEAKSERIPARGFRDATGAVVVWVLLIAGVAGYFRMRSREKETTAHATTLPTDALFGIHGWLRFFIVSLGAIGPALNFGFLARSFQVAEMGYPYLINSTEWATYKTTVWFTLAAFSSFSIYAALQMRFILMPKSVTLAKFAVALWPVTYLAIEFVIPALVFPKLTPASDPQFLLSFFTPILSAVIWIIYLSKSKRVLATYATDPIDTELLITRAEGIPVPDYAPSVVAEVRAGTTLTSVVPGVSADEEDLWATALAEVEGVQRRPGVWAKAFAEADGDETKAKAAYLRVRVQQLNNA